MLKIVLDMNLSPDWVKVLLGAGYHSVHWSTIGNPKAADNEIMEWSRQNGYLVLTHDLDFGTILSLTHAAGPSVILIRSNETFPDKISSQVIQTLKQYETELVTGALIVIDSAKQRIRILPI